MSKFNKIQLFIFLNLFSYLLVAQSIDDEISKIRKWYSETEGKLEKCEVVELNDWVDEDEYSGYTPEITAYKDEKGKIIKIIEKGFADWHEVSKMFYLKEGELFFVFSKGYGAGEMYTAEELGKDLPSLL